MIVSNTNKFIYIKGVKVASTSVEVFFEQFCNKKGIIGYRGPNPIPDNCEWFNHMTPRQIKEKLNNDHTWNEYFKFGCIRNPWERIVSWHSWLIKQVSDNSQRKDSWKEKKDKLAELSFEDFCMQYRLENPNHLLSLYKFYEVDKYHIDFFIRFENLYEDIERVCNALNLSCDLSKLPHKQKSNHRHYTEYYTDKMRDKIAEDYRDDIDFFNYTFGD